MVFSMSVIKNQHGVYIVRRKVPKALEPAVAIVLGNGKQRQAFLQQSLRTKDAAVAKAKAAKVLVAFEQILAKARALGSAPYLTDLRDAEIARLAEVHYQVMLAADEDTRREGTGSEPLFQSIAHQLAEAGVDHNSPWDVGSVPAYGLSRREEYQLRQTIAMVLPPRKRALARGDISVVHDEVEELLLTNGVNLDRSSASYRKLGMEVLKADIRAMEAIVNRSEGQWVDTPPEQIVGYVVPTSGEGLMSAFEGWKKHKEPSKRTIEEFERAIRLFIELHGDVPVGEITPRHARLFREALQNTPRKRTGDLRKMSLPELSQWGQENPQAKRISAATINKQLSGVQTVTKWGKRNSDAPQDARMEDPFAGRRLPKQKSTREPFDSDDLQRLFNSPIYTHGARPIGGQGEAAFWLPLLSLFTGARLSELAGLAVSDIRTDASTGITAIFIVEDRERDRRVKTESSERAVPVHPELVRVGFLNFVADRRAADGDTSWLFPLVAPETNGARMYSKWFGRYRHQLGVTSRNTVFHSFRHAFKDALRKARVGEERSDALTGHKSASVGRSYGAKEMLERFGWKELSDDVARVAYPGLDLSHIGKSASDTRRATRNNRVRGNTSKR